MIEVDDARIAIVGLGYVGLPLAVEFGRVLDTIGYDIDLQRIAQLEQGVDTTREVEPEELGQASHLVFSGHEQVLADCNVYIVTVPTPIDHYKRPNLKPLEKASQMIGRVMQPGAVVIYESTVYPGCTEEFCVPILARESGLTFNRDFFAGYSPERINPGDRKHRLPSILKVASGSTPEVAQFVTALYSRIIEAGVYRVACIRVAEAAKVIENTQRDVNIALINELAMIFNRLGIDTQEVLAAAGTKWNFLPFVPGLVGGHCIGVDPYYLTFKAQEIGYHPEMILAGRRINDNMGVYVASQVVKLMTRRRIHVAGSRILVLGLTFKENCPDIRNTRVVDMVAELQSYDAQVDVYDPWVDLQRAHGYGVHLVGHLEQGVYDAVILAVAHDQFKAMGIASIRALGRDPHVLFDIKHVLPARDVDGRL